MKEKENKGLTPKPGEMFPKNLEYYVGRTVLNIIEKTDNLELSGNAIVFEQVIRFIDQYKTCRDYVIALTYSKNNIPLKPRLLLIERLSEECEELFYIMETDSFRHGLETLGIDLDECRQKGESE